MRRSGRPSYRERVTEKPPQHWDLTVPTGTHRVTVRPTGWSRTTTWTVDGEVVAEKRSSQDKLLLPGGGHGSVRVVFSWAGSSTRATWFTPAEEAQARAGVGGVDLVPEPGSPAAAREDRMRAHPRLYAARHVVAGIAKVVGPFLVLWLLARFTVDVPYPDVPRPDLPDLPLPDLSWPDWRLPGWVRWVLEKKAYLLPVLLGIALATAEVRRRRKQDELRARRDAELADKPEE
jgi:hypothetical protein